MIPIYELPFFNGSTAKPDNDGYPSFLPIELYYDADLKMLRLQNTPETEVILNDVYLKGSLVDGSLSSESGGAYVDRIIDYVKCWSDSDCNSKILEIGPGRGIILKKLKESGFKNLTGIEPGNHPMMQGLEGISIVRDFFPNGISDRYDLLLHFAVWEHIVDPLDFFQTCMTCLADGGRMIFAVPNCGPYVATGDLSIFIHEHYSYFTEESIRRIAQQCGVTLLDVGVIHGMLMGVAIKSPETKISHVQEQIEEPRVFEHLYWTSVLRNLNKLRVFFQGFRDQHDVAVYAPARAINALSIIRVHGVRLVDDSSEMHNRYLPGFINHIESYEDICKSPPLCILIYSSTFGELIKRKCAQDHRLSNTKVLSISDLLS
jgi:SAM-dependent methyltransferase